MWPRPRRRSAARRRSTSRASSPTAKLRYERALARAVAAKDNKAYIAANKGLCGLLGLKDLARLEHGGEVDIVALRKKLEDEVAEALAEDEADAPD